jgi:hypothetical protein
MTGLRSMIYVGKRVPKGFVEEPGAMHMGRGVWMFRIRPENPKSLAPERLAIFNDFAKADRKLKTDPKTDTDGSKESVSKQPKPLK